MVLCNQLETMCNTSFCVRTFGSILSHHIVKGSEGRGGDQEITWVTLSEEIHCFLFFSSCTFLLGALGDLQIQFGIPPGSHGHGSNCFLLTEWVQLLIKEVKNTSVYLLRLIFYYHRHMKQAQSLVPHPWNVYTYLLPPFNKQSFSGSLAPSMWKLCKPL